LKLAERMLEQNGRASSVGREALGLIQAARTSQAPIVARKADELATRP
jgi:hypothetical protein